MKIGEDKLRQIVKEEIRKEDKELNRKLTVYTADLREKLEEESNKYLNEDEGFNEAREEKIEIYNDILSDLNKILYNSNQE